MKQKDQLQKFNNFVIFKTAEGKVNIDVFFANDTLWLTQKIIAELFDTTKQNVSLHLKNIFVEGELIESSAVKEFLTTASDGKTYQTAEYPILKHKGQVSAEDAKEKAETEYEKYRTEQDKNYLSDFDREVQKLLKYANKK